MSHTEMKPASPTHPKVSGSNVDMINKAATKLCHIVKRDDFDGYGFNLHSEKAKPGQFIGKVDANSPAEMAGLKEGDRILEVNGVAINNETHKQVVQRIKAIACEVRLLLLDVDGKGDGFQAHMASNGSNQTMETSSTKTEQILPGASENINSITMVSTKRPSSQASHNSGDNSMDVTDKATNVTAAQQQEIMMNRNSGSIVPPPPSATMASAHKPMTMSMSMMSHSNSSSNSHNNSISSTTTTTMSSNGATVATHAMETTTASSSSGGNGNGNGHPSTTNTTTTIKAGSLQLPMTAAEMRAKLMMKKKYDPKNESVDLKKKYEIVQKL